MPIVEGLEQRTPEWLQMRTGIVTGSRMADVMAYKVKGGEKSERAGYRAELICEIMTGRAADHYINPAMEWGIENEIFARNAYEVAIAEIEPVGFALHPKIKRFGASPDALVGSDGLAEFKCPTTQTHIDYILQGVVPPEYQPQMLAEMACAERQWCDFVSYDPRLPKKYQLFVRRFERDNARIAEMEGEVEKFLEEVDEQIAKLKGSKMVDLDGSLVSKLQESLGDA